MRLIDADALKADLTRFYDGVVTAKQLIDEQPTAYCWINVEDRLPDKGGEMGMRLIDADALTRALTTIDRLARSDKQAALLGRVYYIVSKQPIVDTVTVRRGRWDLCITAKELDFWTADAVCRNCGFTKPKIWSGFFPAVPPGIAHDTTRRHSERVKLPNYCENCGAKMDGGLADGKDA